jgi:hypothetical protein
MEKTRYVLDTLILSLSIMSHRIGKQVIIQEHNKLGSWSAKTLLLQLIHNMTKCPYNNYKKNIKKDAKVRSCTNIILDKNLMTRTLNWS